MFNYEHTYNIFLHRCFLWIILCSRRIDYSRGNLYRCIIKSNRDVLNLTKHTALCETYKRKCFVSDWKHTVMVTRHSLCCRYIEHNSQPTDIKRLLLFLFIYELITYLTCYEHWWGFRMLWVELFYVCNVPHGPFFCSFVALVHWGKHIGFNRYRWCFSNVCTKSSLKRNPTFSPKLFSNVTKNVRLKREDLLNMLPWFLQSLP